MEPCAVVDCDFSMLVLSHKKNFPGHRLLGFQFSHDSAIIGGDHKPSIDGQWEHKRGPFVFRGLDKFRRRRIQVPKLWGRDGDNGPEGMKDLKEHIVFGRRYQTAFLDISSRLSENSDCVGAVVWLSQYFWNYR
jgi:hypothetical protein